MTPHEKWVKVQKYLKKYKVNKTLRYGQSLWGAVADVDIETAQKISNTDDDCFYDDTKVLAFTEKVFELWYEGK